MHGRFSIWGGTCSGVTRDVGALEQGVLTAPPEKIPEIFQKLFSSMRKKSIIIPQKILVTFFQSSRIYPNFRFFGAPSLGCARGWPPPLAPRYATGHWAPTDNALVLAVLARRRGWSRNLNPSVSALARI